MPEPIQNQRIKRPVSQYLLWPLYIFTLPTGAKSFKKNPVIGNRLLNLLGLHVLRVILAAGIMKIRRLPLIWMLNAEDRKTFARDGFLIKTDFLPAELFTRLKEEAQQQKIEARICLQGDAITHRVLLDQQTLENLPACKNLLDYRPYRYLLAFTSGRLRSPGTWIQKVYTGVFPDKEDPQLTLHSDSFHPTTKSWLFLENVTEDIGPFNYVPGSHRLTFKRLIWEYRRSLQVLAGSDHYSASGSFRLNQEDTETLGLPPAKSCVVPENSVVIADTHGFHCRGSSAAGSSRLAIWNISRTNPFNPLPGLPFAILNRVDLYIFRTHLRLQDMRATRLGNLPSWRKVNKDWRPENEVD